MSESEVTDALVYDVSAAAGDVVTDEQTAAVLLALQVVIGGDKVGTIKRNPDTGEIATRQLEDGRPVWWVTGSNKPYRNAQGTLSAPWVTLYEPEEAQ